MWNQKIGISLGNDYGIPTPQLLKLIKGIGFDAVSPVWETPEELAEFVRAARESGLLIQSLHAPFLKAAAMWSQDCAVSTPAKEELLTCIDACVRFQIPVLVVHTWIGFDYRFCPETLYYGNFDETVSYAGDRGIRIAFENTEGEEYFFALMEHFRNDPAVGFCWDSGHELCYNHSQDLLAKYGDRLIMTHLNDNLGISRFDGTTFWTDDLHLLPYDGIADWDDTVARLKKARHMDILNFELAIASKPDRHDNDIYGQMPLELYFTEAYKRACKIAYRYSK